MLAQLPGDQVVAFVLLDIAIILVVARLVGGLALKIGQPRVVGEIGRFGSEGGVTAA